MPSKNKNKTFQSAANVNSPKLFRVDLANVRGLRTNFNAVTQHLGTAKPHLLFLTETQIARPADTAHLTVQGNTPFKHFELRGGVCLYGRSDVSVRRLYHVENSRYPVIWVRVNLPHVVRIYAGLYRSPNLGARETVAFFEYLSGVTDKLLGELPTAEIVIAGDFNGHQKSGLDPRLQINLAGRLTIWPWRTGYHNWYLVSPESQITQHISLAC